MKFLHQEETRKKIRRLKALARFTYDYFERYFGHSCLHISVLARNYWKIIQNSRDNEIENSP